MVVVVVVVLTRDLTHEFLLARQWCHYHGGHVPVDMTPPSPVFVCRDPKSNQDSRHEARITLNSNMRASHGATLTMSRANRQQGQAINSHTAVSVHLHVEKCEIQEELRKLTHALVFTVKPSICTEYETAPEVISQSNPMFWYSLGETDTEQVTANTRSSQKSVQNSLLQQLSIPLSLPRHNGARPTKLGNPEVSTTDSADANGKHNMPHD